MDTNCLLKCYRQDPVLGTRTLAFHGPVVSAEETGQDNAQSIAVTAAGPYWRMAKRLIPGSKNKVGFGFGTAASLVDLGMIARQIVFDTNAENFTGIDLGTHAPSVDGWVGKWVLKNSAEAIAELAAGQSSFEFRVRPTEPVAYANPPYNWPRIGIFDVQPLFGVARPDAVFEYGTTRANVQSYSRSRSRDGQLTHGWISAPGFPDGISKKPDGSDLYDSYQYGNEAAKLEHGWFDEVVNDAGVLDNELRQLILNYHLEVRKNPREIVTFRPAINARPAPFIHYDVGDTVRARAVVRGNVRFDALFRIWGLSFELDQNGNETVELELIQP